MNDQTIPAEIVGAETETQDYQHRGELRREYATRITVVINTPDLARVDLTRPITIHQENPPRKGGPAPALPDGWRLADHKLYGRVIVTSTSTSPNDDGYVYILLSTTESKGYDWVFCPVNRLTFLDTGKETDQ